MRHVGAGLVLALLTGCGDDAAPSSSRASGAEDPPSGSQASMASPLPAWGGALPPGDLAIEGPMREAELGRDRTSVAVREALQDDDPAVAARAAWAMARIGGDEAAMVLRTALELDATSTTPAFVAALAFLQPPATQPGEPPEPDGSWASLADGLWSRYAVTEDPAMGEALLLAIARVGGARSQHLLAADLAVLPDDEGVPRWVAGMQAVAIACTRGYPVHRDGLRAIAQALADTRSQIRQAAAYALGRCAGPSAEQLAGSERGELVRRLAPLLAADDRDEARLGWRALAGLGEVVDPVPPTVLGNTPRPWLVEVEAVTALAGHADGRTVLVERLAALSLDHAEGPRVHVLLAALRGLRRSVEGAPQLLAGLAPLRRRLEAAFSSRKGRHRKALALVRCELLVLEALRTGDPQPVATCADGVDGIPDTHGDALVVDALMQMGTAMPRDTKLDALVTRARDPRPAVAAPAVSALADVDDPRVAPVLREAVARDDAGVQAAAAAAIAARSIDAAKRDEAAIPMLLDVVRSASNDTEVEARIAAIEALGHFARPRGDAGDAPDAVPPWLESTIVPLATDPAWAIRAAARNSLLGHDELVNRFDASVPASFPRAFGSRVGRLPSGSPPSGLLVTTDAGTFTIEFSGAPAPIMQANLVQLAAEGRFDGLTFHRVVPGFVVQGGDPRGDGYGGPGWLVPCEWSNIRYERGTVGIALAGKDTGGSQFFVTHTAQPHLDGRYTVIGRVTDGMDVVDRILEHDRIERIEVVP